MTLGGRFLKSRAQSRRDSHRAWARLITAWVFALLSWGLSVPAGAADAVDFVIESGPVEGQRAADGASTVKLNAVNLSPNELALSIEAANGDCGAVTGKPTLKPYTSGEVTFTMNCQKEGTAPRDAVVMAEFAGATEAPIPESIPLQIVLKPTGEAEWSALARFACPAPLVALIAVAPPYLFWLRRPRGNPDAEAAATAGPDDLGNWKSLKNMGVRLPGITKDWSFKDNWASSASLAAALFTTVFAAADPLKAILGDAGSAKVSAIAVAAAVSTAIIGSGPLWLTICKRRYERDNGISADNTIGGVLLGSIVVLIGALGLLYTAAEILDQSAAWWAALATTAVLLLYSWKSIPQTLALGYFGTNEEATVSASL